MGWILKRKKNGSAVIHSPGGIVNKPKILKDKSRQKAVSPHTFPSLSLSDPSEFESRSLFLTQAAALPIWTLPLKSQEAVFSGEGQQGS